MATKAPNYEKTQSLATSQPIHPLSIQIATTLTMFRHLFFYSVEQVARIASSIVIIVEESSVAHIHSATIEERMGIHDGPTSKLGSSDGRRIVDMYGNTGSLGNSLVGLDSSTRISLECGNLGGDSGFYPNTIAPMEGV
ncbi:hypothetical protein HAX54_002982 [Datura stramonium]|uniref:Uncharacterized protein n=1 Tax=Datura stramonium TaxID=4076 RepID=A0ABS8T5D4_DATST|nr:hypothetical protein [Datura stramonium]